jgi:FkbH-like protein
MGSTKPVKCVVWDLDDTVWHGTLLEGDDLRLRGGVIDCLRILDERGILHSVASRNEPEQALAALRRFGIDGYFLAPQIGWSNKSESVARIAKLLNIGIDALAFIDDQEFERGEVAHVHPTVLCLPPEAIPGMPDMAAFTPLLVTPESRRRRHMYRADLERQRVEAEFDGPAEAFLATLNMEMTIAPAAEDDLLRAEELTIRTNQLNTSGETFDREQLAHFIRSPDHLLLMAELADRYGSYGKIGMALIEMGPAEWTIRLLLMSCRVMARGVGGVLINFIRDLARARGVRLRARFVANERNRMMYVTYKFNHFREVGRDGDRIEMENDLGRIVPVPDYVRLNAIAAADAA